MLTNIFMKNIIIKIQLLIIILLSSGINAYSQNNRTFVVIPKFHYGYIMAHHESMEYIIKQRVPSVDYMFGLQLLGNQKWQQIHNYPMVGFGYYYADLGNKTVLGEVNSLCFFIAAPFIKLKKYSLEYNFSLGLSHISKYYNHKTNYYNFAIGTPVNLHVNFNLEHKYKITNKLTLLIGVGFTHFSNAAYKMPNYGLNVTSCSFGANYFVFKQKPERIINEIPKFKKKFDLLISQSIGLEGSNTLSEDLYFLSNISFNFGQKFNHQGRWGVGFDVFYNNIFSNYYESNELNYKQLDLIQYGTHVSYDVILGKIQFTFQFGAYLYRKFYDYKKIYERIGVKYMFSKHFYYHISLIAYFGKAQNPETGFGFYF